MRFVRLSPLLFVAWACLLLAQPARLAFSAEDTTGHGAIDHAKEGEHAESDDQADKPNPLAVDLDLAIWTGVVFAALMFVLGKFAWPAISAALEEREQRIEGNIAAAEAKLEESKNLLAQHEAKLAGAADEVRGLLEEARRDAEHTKTQILAEAKKAADLERDRAVRDVERAADHAMKNLAETSANMAIDLAGKVVRQNSSADQQAELVREALGKLASSSPSQN